MSLLLHPRRFVAAPPIRLIGNYLVTRTEHKAAEQQTEPASETDSCSEPKEHYDIIIGGGGMVGTTLAAALSSNRKLSDKKILLLEGAAPFKGFDVKAPYSNRVSAINQHSIELFKTIGMWEHMQKARIKSVKQMQVWEASSDALIQFQHDHFASDIACIVENGLILDAAYAQMQKAQVPVINRARIKCVSLPDDTGATHTEVTLNNGNKYTCELLVGADGANSVVRKQMAVDVFTLNYKSMSLVATLELDDNAGDNAVAWQRFLPTGPVALLPLSEKESSLVWSTTIQHARQLLAMPSTEFVDTLNEALCKQYAKVEVADRALQLLNSFCGYTKEQAQHKQYPPRICGVQDKSRATYPLGFLHASAYVTEGAVIIGDAAHRIHPLAGQGVNIGFSDVNYLMETLAAAVYAGARLGDKHYLRKYEQKCLAKNVPIMAGVHALHRLYETNFTPAVVLRGLGLQLTQNLPVLKQLFMKRAMG